MEILYSENNKLKGMSIVLMGVSSTGKSSIGFEIAHKLHAKFIDGDDLHPKANIIKMSEGYALNDDDRAPWLERIRDVAFSIEKKSETAVLVCSALKKSYRDKIREENNNVRFLFLHGELELVISRMQQRKNHFMPVSLLKSQFETLETPDAQIEQDVYPISINDSFNNVAINCLNTIKYF